MIGDDKWFASCDDFSLCRVGGNGPINVTQVMPLVKYTQDGESLLDVGCGSGTTFDALLAIKRDIKYKGIDFIERRIEWLKETFKQYRFAKWETGDARKLKEKDQSWDTVWSRHVIDHLGSFEEAMDEHCRVARKRVICILWMQLSEGDEHLIKPIIEGPVDDRTTYPDEWTNQYSKKKVLEYLEKKKAEGWDLVEFREDCPWNESRFDKGHDTIIMLERIEKDEKVA